MKGLDDKTASVIYDGLLAPGGINRKGELNLAGIDTVLALRRQEGSKTGDASRYIDASYREKALGK